MASSDAPPLCRSASAAALELLSQLPQEHKFAFGGLCACLLGRRMPVWGEPFCQQILQRIAQSMLSLDMPQSEALPAFLDKDGPTTPDNFVDLLPPDAEYRGALVLALLVLTVAAEDAELAGYDARSRQLLCDLTTALQVPWRCVAGMERELACSMKAQATSHRTTKSHVDATTAAVVRQAGRSPNDRLRSGSGGRGVQWRGVSSASTSAARALSPVSELGQPSRFATVSSANGSEAGGGSSSGGSSSGGGGGDVSGGVSGGVRGGSVGGGSESSSGSSGRFSISRRWKKRLAVGAMGVASGLAIGLTAGLAAPMVVAGLGTVGAGLSGLGGAATIVGGTVSATANILSRICGCDRRNDGLWRRRRRP